MVNFTGCSWQLLSGRQASVSMVQGATTELPASEQQSFPPGGWHPEHYPAHVGTDAAWMGWRRGGVPMPHAC